MILKYFQKEHLRLSKQRRAVTLIEVLIVIGILASVLSMTLFKSSFTHKRTALINEKQKLTAFFTTVHSSAIYHNADAVVACLKEDRGFRFSVTMSRPLPEKVKGFQRDLVLNHIDKIEYTDLSNRKYISNISFVFDGTLGLGPQGVVVLSNKNNTVGFRFLGGPGRYEDVIS